MPTNPPDPASVAARLTKAQRQFLINVCDGRKLPCADREEDRARQKLRRLGLVRVAGSPRRWVPQSLGLAVRAALQAKETK